MSGHIACTCKGTREEKMKSWYVSRRNFNLSHFESPKGQRHYSEYSTVMCKNCQMFFRSKANYINQLPDGEVN